MLIALTLSLSIVQNLHKTMTMEEREHLHPLELNDKVAFEIIKTVSTNPNPKYSTESA